MKKLSSCFQRSFQSCSPIQSTLAPHRADIRGGKRWSYARTNIRTLSNVWRGMMGSFGLVVAKEQTPTICLTLEIKHTTLSYPFGFNVVKGSSTSPVFFEIDHQDGYVCRCDTFHSRSLSNCPR